MIQDLCLARLLLIIAAHISCTVCLLVTAGYAYFSLCKPFACKIAYSDDRSERFESAYCCTISFTVNDISLIFPLFFLLLLPQVIVALWNRMIYSSSPTKIHQ